MLSRVPDLPRADEIQDGLNLIETRSGSLGRFLRAYAQLARLPKPQMRKVAMAPLAHRIAELENRLPVSVKAAQDIAINADPDQLEQLLINLVRNAVDATLETGGGVWIDWEAVDGGVQVTVEDEGPGLPDTSNLFVPFFTTKPSGSGIGLALSRQIAEAHGGTLTLENRRAGGAGRCYGCRCSALRGEGEGKGTVSFLPSPFCLIPLLLSPPCAAGPPFPFWFSRSRRWFWPPPPPRAPRRLRPALPTLTTIGAIRALSQDEGARGYPVRVRGIVTHVDEQADVSLIVHDGQLGQFFMPPTDAGATAAWRELQRGDLVEIEGRTVRGGFAPNVDPKIVRRLGQAPLPRPKTIAFGSMLSGRHDCDYVEITGVVQRAWRPSDPRIRTLFMDVAVEEGVVRAAFWDFGTQDFERFVDARVRLRGNVGSLFGRTEQLRGVSLFVGHTGDIVVLEPPPDPATLVDAADAQHLQLFGAGEVNRRIRIRGVVTSYIPGHPVEISDFTTTAKFRYVRNVLYVDDGTGGARIETEQPQRVEPGTIVDVAGFPAVTPGKPILTNAVFTVAGMAPQPAAVAGERRQRPERRTTTPRWCGCRRISSAC